MRRLTAAAVWLAAALSAQPRWEQRGFLETRFLGYPQTVPTDSGRAVGESLLRYEWIGRPRPGIKLNWGADARTDSHRQFDREARVDWEDRRLARPALSLRRLSVSVNRKGLTLETGRQFIRWGKTDILTPTDRFAPKDFLSVAYSDFLPVWAARLTYERGADTVDLVWQARFTPSRGPLLLQRWTPLPDSLFQSGLPLRDAGSRFPGGTPWGVRWNHTGRGYEASLSFYEGHNHLPQFEGRFRGTELEAQRFYPQLRLYGADFARPLPWFTLKAEAAYYTTRTRGVEEFVLYVIQLERTKGEWTFVGGYAGEAVTQTENNPLAFAPDRGLAKAFLGRASYNLDTNRSIAFDTAVRQNGRGVLARFEYSHALGTHWRATAGVSMIRGQMTDFLGQYRRNSAATFALRYSF
jgi:hypothetical protein